MSTQPEALRLADALGNLEATGHCSDSVSLTDRSEAIADAAAAKLRWLHASCEDYAQHKQRQDQRVLALTAQRDALLEALQDLCDTLGECGMTEKARAAIKAVEEGE